VIQSLLLEQMLEGNGLQIVGGVFGHIGAP
jgi:hypothetical protein